MAMAWKPLPPGSHERVANLDVDSPNLPGWTVTEVMPSRHASCEINIGVDILRFLVFWNT